MIRHLFVIILFYGCAADPKSRGNDNELSTKDSTKVEPTDFKADIHYDQLKQYLLNADSVVLFSHYSPNEPIINPKTGKYYPGSISFIENGTINYAISVQERKQLNKIEIQKLLDILTLPATDDITKTVCFQPRNAIVAFKKNQISFFDFCFDCFGFSKYGNFNSDIVMSTRKYEKLIEFYKKVGFKYEMD